MAQIEIKDVKKRYKTGVTAIYDLNLEIEKENSFLLLVQRVVVKVL